MHPSKFFSEVNCQVYPAEYDIQLKEKLQTIHPLNFLSSKLRFPVYKVQLEYDTVKDNHKNAEKYMVMNVTDDKDEQFEDMWAEMYCNDYNNKHPENPMKNISITDVQHICDAVLQIG